MWWSLLSASIVLVALVQVALHSLLVWENRRFMRRRLARQAGPVASPSVALIAPCKGIDDGLEANLRALFRQDHPDYEIVFVVESDDDPASAVIRRLAADEPQVPSRLVVAGAAVDSGQKVHNLQAATSRVGPDREVLAFVDSDARPGSQWLGRLVERLAKPEIGATTGYRWLLPRRPTLANCVLYSINAAVATMFGPGGHFLVWGGSWAIRREVFESIGLRRAWSGTLSDDLVASRCLRQAGLRIEFVPECLIASNIDLSWPALAEFVRRQYIIGRCYAPLYWAAALGMATFATLAFWGSIAGCLAALVRGRDLGLPLAAAVALYAGHVWRGGVRGELATRVLADHAVALRWPIRLDRWAGPLVAVVNWLALVASCLGRQVTWRGIRYSIRPGGQIEIVARGAAGTRLQPHALRGPHYLSSIPASPDDQES